MVKNIVAIVCDQCDLLCENTYLDEDGLFWCCQCLEKDPLTDYCNDCKLADPDEISG